MKAKIFFSVYDMGGGFGFWTGGLLNMYSGSGYQYFSNTITSKSFYYPSSPSKSPITEYKPAYELKCTHQFGRYRGNMTVTAVVVRNNEEIQDDHIEIQALSGEECRGAVLMRYEERLDRYFGFGFGERSLSIKNYRQR